MINYIVLEGIEMYVFLFLILFVSTIGIISLLVAINSDNKVQQLREDLHEEKEKNTTLNHANFHLKLKYGLFDVEDGEK